MIQPLRSKATRDPLAAVRVKQNREPALSAEILLSVVTVTYNDRAPLELTLESCRAQLGARSDCEFLVIDGGSTDGTEDVIARYPDVVSKYVSEPDRGIYDAMNKGLAIASGRYVMYLNAGDVWSDNTALEAVRASLLEASPKWLIGGALSLEGGKRKRIIKNIPHSWLRHALGLQSHCHQSTLVERNLMMSLSGFSESYDFAGDFDLIFRLGLIAEPCYLPRTIVTYSGGGISAQNANRISYLQRKVRSDRMHLGGFAETLNGGYMRYHQFRRALIPIVISLKQLPAKFRSHML